MLLSKSTPVLLLFLFVVAVTPVQCSWWFLSRLQVASVGISGTAMCNLVPGLSRRQRKLCQMHPAAMEAVGEGVKMAVGECQRQFTGDRWNCSAVESAGLGRVLLKLGSREAAFVYSISSAGVTHAIARACSKGMLSDCQCGRADGRGQAVAPDGSVFAWGGCSDNVRFASSFVRRFVDAKEKRQHDARALMNLHNNRAGRKIVKTNMRLQCKCHGVSGSCTTKTCWKAVPPFEDIGRLLKAKYEHAMQVTVSQQGAQLLPSAVDVRLDDPIANRSRSSRLHKSAKERVRRSDLVFFEPSPDYCVRDAETGSLGTAGRPCNKTSSGADSCDLLCCGRGYDTKRVVVNEQCECKFVWCCEVKCHTCRKVVDIHTCKGAAPILRSEFFRAHNNTDHPASKPLDTPGRFRYHRRDYKTSYP